MRPALTTTKLWSTRTTSAEITSPARMSWRVSDSSNRAAKDSVFGVEVCRSDIKIWICMVSAAGAASIGWLGVEAGALTFAAQMQKPYGVKGLRHALLPSRAPLRLLQLLYCMLSYCDLPCAST
ncbi:hypothetical protein PUN4_930031 [Paraburkholderia unamae]|nr:hypothetical protein PUN4_930031 [Paraburkholderia unamae]